MRAGLVTYYANVLNANKRVPIDPVVYANIPWVVAHLALGSVYDENESPETMTILLQNVVCFNRGLLEYLLLKKNKVVS